MCIINIYCFRMISVIENFKPTNAVFLNQPKLKVPQYIAIAAVKPFIQSKLMVAIQNRDNDISVTIG